MREANFAEGRSVNDNDERTPFNVGEQALAPPLLLQYWQVARRWKWVIGGIILSALVLGFLVTLLTTPQYSASARIELSREQKNLTKAGGAETRTAGRDAEFLPTQYKLLEARSVAESVVRQLKLGGNAAFFEAHGVDVDGGPFGNDMANARLSARDREAREKTAIGLLSSNISITPVRGSTLVDVSYTSGSPTISAQVANAWTEQFIATSLEKRFAASGDARTYLEGRLNDLRTRLEQSERDLINYASEKDIISLSRTKDADVKHKPSERWSPLTLRRLTQVWLKP